MKAKKLIEVALPIKEISAESVRDKSIRHGHISTLHLWWARRPLPVCRAIVFASLVPDPLDENCPEAFKWAIQELLCKGYSNIAYRPYKDIPYTSIVDEMEDNWRNRLMMFIGKFSDKCQADMIAGKSTPSKIQLDDWSLIKWENKNNPQILRIARELIFVAYQSDKRPEATWEQLHEEFNQLYDAIPKAEEYLYSIPDRHLETEDVKQAEADLKAAIDAFQNEMPSVFDPFAGGGAIPLEAARLGCRSYGNDINPVAHIIERSSAEFPQKYGKPITYSKKEFKNLYGDIGEEMAKESNRGITFDGKNYYIPNRLAFDVEFYATKLLADTKKEVDYLYPSDGKGKTPVAYYWVRTAKCSNPSCGAEVPLLRSFYLCKTSRKKVYLNPIIKGSKIQFEIKEGNCNIKEWNHRGNLTCPCCGNITEVETVKEQSKKHGLPERLVAIISESNNGKVYNIPNDELLDKAYNFHLEENCFKPTEKMPVDYIQAFPSCTWGYETWGDLFSNRQLIVLNSLSNQLSNLFDNKEIDEYKKVIKTYIAILIDKQIDYYNSFCTWDSSRETDSHVFSRQAISMVFDYPEANIFSDSTGCFKNMIDWVVRYLISESANPFSCDFRNSSSGEKTQFESKQLTAVVTDPPYYDAIGYADCSDFFYVWLKHTLKDVFPIIFSTPKTPKTDECTALVHYHGTQEKAKQHFESKLTQIFDAIEDQTSDIVSIMFAHQSTEAWTTLCNSILGARMNITGSWPMDTELANRSVGLQGAALESSVTVACRPSERKGYADFGDVKHNIRQLVKHEVEKLYGLGFRGADLLTACFGQAVSVFGHYKLVETAEGEPVSVGQLLEFARESAAQALLEGVPGEPQTKFYCGWLQMNGMGECDFDDVNKYTRVGVNIEIRQLQQDKLLISNGSKQHLASAAEHLSDNSSSGTRPNDFLISQVHRMMLDYRYGKDENLLIMIRNYCQESDAPHWRVLDFLLGHMPECDDLKDIKGLLSNAEMLRLKSKQEIKVQQGNLMFED